MQLQLPMPPSIGGSRSGGDPRWPPPPPPLLLLPALESRECIWNAAAGRGGRWFGWLPLGFEQQERSGWLSPAAAPPPPLPHPPLPRTTFNGARRGEEADLIDTGLLPVLPPPAAAAAAVRQIPAAAGGADAPPPPPPSEPLVYLEKHEEGDPFRRWFWPAAGAAELALAQPTEVSTEVEFWLLLPPLVGGE